MAEVQPVTGIVMVISYLDTKGQPSTRQIVCRRIEQFADKAYLVARCELRQQSRTFNISRIASAIDPATGQIYEPGSKLLEAFTVDRQSTGRYRFGLSPKAFGRFNAALNILAFVARCDGKWHVLETEAIESFVMACWLRLDFPGDLDLAAVTAHVSRLAPDDEALWRSVYEVANHPAMARLVVQHLGRVIDADGVHHLARSIGQARSPRHCRTVDCPTAAPVSARAPRLLSRQIAPQSKALRKFDAGQTGDPPRAEMGPVPLRIR